MKTAADPVGQEPLPRPEIDISRLFGWRIWKLAALSGAPVIRLCEGRFGVSRQEWSILCLVAQAGQISPSDLAEQIGLDRPRASKAVRALIVKGLLLRLQARGQGRRFVVQLTPAGHELVQDLYPQVRLVSDRVLAGLEPAARRQFEEALAILTAHAATLNTELFADVKANRGGRFGSR